MPPGLPKIRRVHIFTISPEKHGGEVDFWPANKRKRFLQFHSITLGLCSQVCNIFVVSQGKLEG